MPSTSRLAFTVVLSALWAGCSSASSATGAGPDTSSTDAGANEAGPVSASLPLTQVADQPLPGAANRFDYQDIDPGTGHLVVAHMNDASVVITDLSGALLKVLSGIPTPRGVVAADDVGLVFVTSSPGTLVIIDNKTLTEKSRVTTGRGPDGVGWDPVHKVVGVSDQGDGAISLITDSGSGTRTQLKLGSETGNVVFDQSRGLFWITVVGASPPNQLVSIDPVKGAVVTTIPLPGCDGAHGLRIHPDGKSALIACENNDTLARADLDGAHAVSLAKTGAGPDVLAIDPGLGWLYVAAESGDLTVFDITRPGVVVLGHDHPGDNAHSVAVDPATHHVFFPLEQGPNGTPVMRVMQPMLK